MIVLSRKEGERLQIGNDISLTITKCARGRVTIGIEAPKEIRVLRGEIVDEYSSPSRNTKSAKLQRAG